MKLLLISILVLVVGCSNEQPINPPTDKWIKTVLEYSPAPGQFINSSIGNASSTDGIIGGRGIVTLGGYGGYIVFKFGKPVKNGTGVDFVIHGNAFKGSSEPGIVMVSVDANGNGIADDKWVELKGSNYDSSIKDYVITYKKPSNTTSSTLIEWSDNKGGNGFINTTTEHPQSYWPLWLTENIVTFSGNRIANTPFIEDNLWVMPSLQWGYADNFSNDYLDVIGNDVDTKYSNKFDLSNAIESMQSADFIKVYTAINEQAGVLGEASSEVCGAIIINY